MRRVVSSLAVIVVIGGSVAATASAAHGRPETAKPRHVNASMNAAQHWLTARRTAVIAEAHSGHPNAMTGPTLSYEAGLIQAGHLGGRKHSAVIDVRETSALPLTTQNTRNTAPAVETQGSPLGVTARDGRTGRKLWSREYSPTDGYRYVFVERIGKDDLPGVIVETDTFESSGPDTTKVTVSLRALSGANGHLVWSTSVSGTYNSDDSETEIPQLRSPFYRGKGTPIGYFFVLTSETANDGMDPQVTTEQGLIVSGTDGSESNFGDPVTAPSSDQQIDETGVPDQNEDGIGDVVVTESSSPGEPGYAELLSGKTQKSLWKRDLSIEDPDVDSIGRFSSTSHPDLMISGEDTTEVLIDRRAPTAIRPEDDVQYANTVLNGATGHVVLSHDASDWDTISTAARHRKAALMFYQRTTETTTPKAAQRPGRTTYDRTALVQLTAVDAKNVPFYDKTVSVTTSTTNMNLDASSTFYRFGDVQPDGFQDYAIDVSVGRGRNTVSKEGILDGSTGKITPEADVDEPTDGSLAKGSGTDNFTVRLKDGQPRITATDAANGDVFYHRTVTKISAQLDIDYYALRGTGNPCSDLTTQSISKTKTVAAMYSGRGTLLWDVRYTPSQVISGTLTSYKEPKHYCES